MAISEIWDLKFELYNTSMRIISGNLKGRDFNSPAGNRTRPMSDKVRGAIFNSLGDIEGLTVLDAFTGSGGLAYEAISRGAKHVTAIDIDKSAIPTVVKNSKALGISNKIKAIRANVSGWSDTVSKDGSWKQGFDLIFCDPPYDQVQLGLLQKLVRHLKTGGLYVLSWPGKLAVPEFIGLKMLKTKSYGDAQLAFYRRIP